MAHYKIFQITEQELSREEYITEDSFEYHNICNFADGVCNLDEDEEEQALKSLDKILKGVFKRKGRKLTYLGAEEFVNDWIAYMKAKMAELDNQNIKEFSNLFNLRCMTEYTHRNYEDRFYLGEDGEAFADSLGEFIRDIYTYNKKGDVFYVGGIVDFHI